MNGKVRDVAGVTEEFGVPPSLMIDYQTLVGDPVDNVPGVHKVGPKTAAKWLLEYGSLDNLMAHAHEIKGVAGENLRQAVDWLPKGRALVTMKTDCDLNGWVPGLPSLASLHLHAPDKDKLLNFYQTYGFKGLVQSLGGAMPAPVAKKAAKPKDTGMGDLFGAAQEEPAALPELDTAASAVQGELKYDTVLDWATFDQWLARIEQAPLTAIDTETTSLDAMRAEIVGISLSVTPGEAAYIPLAHNGPGAPEQLPLADVLAKLKPWLENPARPKLGQNIKYDRHVFANHGVEVQGYAHDTMLESYVLEVHKPHGLSSLAERHVGRRGVTYEDLCGKGVHQIPFAQVDVDKAAHYSCEDADQCLDVHLALWPQIEAHAGLKFVYDLEIATSEALYRIERNGVLIDAPTLAAQSQALGERIVQLETEAYEIAGQPFNLASPKQLGEIFLTSWACPSSRKPPPAHAAPTKRCWKNWPRTTRCPPASWSTAACPSSKAPTPTSWRSWPCRAQAACTPTMRRRWPSQAACRATSPICRTSRAHRRRPQGA